MGEKNYVAGDFWSCDLEIPVFPRERDACSEQRVFQFKATGQKVVISTAVSVFFALPGRNSAGELPGCYSVCG